MYSQQAVGRRRSVRYGGGASGRSSPRRPRSQEQVRLLQMAVCLALFLTIFVLKGIFPQRLSQVQENILTLVSANIDFKEALSRLGESLTDGESVLSDFGAFCVEVFGAEQEEKPAEQVSFVPPRSEGILNEELKFLGQGDSMAVRTAHYAGLSRFGLELREEVTGAPSEAPPAEEPPQPEEGPAVPAAGTVVAVSDYSGQALPENYTMDRLSLGELETMTPVMGRLTSDYGYRDHPVVEKNLFHGGVDIGGQVGDPVAAFAAGTVEYTGKNDSFGLYLQIDHGNGVKSFYAHCSKVVVKKGQTVAMGEKIAEIGSTGISTGPHLHLELKYNKMHLNPAYYVEFLEQ